jgi:hypothetical protein
MARRLAAATILLVAGIAPAWAQQAPPPRLTFDLDVPEGRSSFFRLDEIGSVKTLTAQLQVRELRRHQDWNAAFSIVLRSAESSWALQFGGEARGNRLRAKALTKNGLKTGEVDVDGLVAERGQQVTLTLDWGQPGMVSVSRDGQPVARIPLDFSPTAVEVSASTSEVLGGVFLGPVRFTK